MEELLDHYSLQTGYDLEDRHVSNRQSLKHKREKKINSETKTTIKYSHGNLERVRSMIRAAGESLPSFISFSYFTASGQKTVPLRPSVDGLAL